MQRFSLDIRDAIIPFSLLEISALFKKLEAGGLIEILTRNQTVFPDLEHILRNFDYDISQHNVLIDNEPSIRILLRKKPATPQ
jgi:TusA-related sulfurtransferase